MTDLLLPIHEPPGHLFLGMNSIDDASVVLMEDMIYPRNDHRRRVHRRIENPDVAFR